MYQVRATGSVGTNKLTVPFVKTTNHDLHSFRNASNASDPNNYRPISILPVVGKIIEKVIFKQLYEYLTHKNLLAGSRNGFRPVHSSLTALLETTNSWYLNIDDSLIIKGVLFLDREKVFDTVNHNILLKNLMCNFMVSTRMQFIRSNHNNQIAFRVLM